MWAVYIATRPNVGLARPWSDTEIEVVRSINPQPIAYYSGWDDPVAIKAKAQRLNLRPCLDDEDGIRLDGVWVQPNLDTVGSGLYGRQPVHNGRHAAFHIASWYLSNDPSATWPATWPAPGTPCGWQWRNTHPAFGVGVDSSWLDDWFGGDDMATIDEIYIELRGDKGHSKLDRILAKLDGPKADPLLGFESSTLWDGVDTATLHENLSAVLAAVKALAPASPTLAQDVADIKATLARIFK